MPLFRHQISRRDAILILLGASCMHIFSTFFFPFSAGDIVLSSHWSQSHHATPPVAHVHNPLAPDVNHTPTRPKNHPKQPHPETKPYVPPVPPASPPEIANLLTLPETAIVSHAPGWTIFRNLYMAQGTLFIVSSQPPSYFPPIRMMISTALIAENTPENIKMREPTREVMDIISLEEAKKRWGGDVESGENNRIWTVEGNTLLVNDPGQFLAHYYHFVAELLLGAWAFWTGSFSPIASSVSDKDILPIHRTIFAKANADAWRDHPGFNAYFFRAAFPSMTIEHENDWVDRVLSTTPPPSQYSYSNPDPNHHLTSAKIRLSSRAWHFPLVFVADRSAAFRGESCGSRTQRTASEAWEAMSGKERLSKGWWEIIRRRVARFAGVNPDSQPTLVDGKDLTDPERIVITYISRQGGRRSLIEDDHDILVSGLEELVQRKNLESRDGGGEAKGREWELNIVKAEKLTKDEQVRLAAGTTILLGVHGNGLTHLVLMPPSKVSAVIEIFYPGGFAHDYEWTTRALGMKHFAFWNDTYHTYPNEPQVSYPDGFQGVSIPVYGPAVAQLIEDWVEGKL